MRRDRVSKPVAKVRRGKRKPRRLDDDDEDDEIEPVDGCATERKDEGAPP